MGYIIIIIIVIWDTLAVQWLHCLPNVHKALGLIPNTTETECGSHSL